MRQPSFQCVGLTGEPYPAITGVSRIRRITAVSASLLAFAGIYVGSPQAAFATSYSLVSAVHGIGATEIPAVAQTNGSSVTRTVSGSQALTPNWTFDYAANATASASDGVLKGYSFIDIYCYNEPYCSGTPAGTVPSYIARTQSSYGDTITVSSASHNGESGYATFYYMVDGSTTVTQLGATTDVDGQVTLCNGFCRMDNVISSISFSDNPGRILVGTIPITYGQSFQFAVNLFTTAHASYSSGTLAAVYLESNYGDTATFAQLGTFTSDGTPVNDATVQSDSGFDYDADLLSVSTPEPSFGVMVGTGVVCLFGFAVRRQRRLGLVKAATI